MCGFHCAVGERSTVEGHLPVGARNFHHFADEREAVGVGAGAGQTDHDVARLNALAVNDFVFFHDAHGKARKIVFAVGIHARHFCRLTADQSAACEFAAMRNALDHTFGRVHVKFAATEIIKEKEAFGTLNENVVDAHGHQILTDRIVTVELEGKHELGSYAVSAGNEHRVFIVFADFKESAESADGTEHARNHGALGSGFDAIDKFIAVVNGDTGGGIGKLSHCFDGAVKRI